MELLIEQKSEQKICDFNTFFKSIKRSFIKTEENINICSLCYTICMECLIEKVHLHSILQSSDTDCACTSHQDPKTRQKKYQNLFKNIHNFNDLLIANDLISQDFSDNQSLVYQIWQQDIDNMIKDKNMIKNLKPREKIQWENYSPKIIDQKINFVKIFEKKIEDFLLFGFNTSNLLQMFSLDYILKILESPEYSYGTEIYNCTLNYQTFILRKQFLGMNFLDAESVKNTTIQQRQTLQIINRMLMEQQFFSKTFNIVEFVLKLIDNYIPSANVRWIKGEQKVHEYSIELALILFKYGMIDVENGNRIINMLESKINNLKNLEIMIQKVQQKTEKLTLATWRNSLMLIRQNYIEIILLQIYNYLDDLIITQKNDNFNKYGSNIMESKFFAKLQMIVLNYVISETYINNESLLNHKTKVLCIEFFNILYNYHDGYSLNLTSSKRPKFKKKNLNYLTKMEKLDGFFEEVRNQNFDKKLIRQFFVTFIESFKKSKTEELFTSERSKTELKYIFIRKILLIAHLFEQQLRKDTETGQIMQNILEYSYKKSSYCLFFQTDSCYLIKGLLNIWPLNTIKWLDKSFSNHKESLQNQNFFNFILQDYSKKIMKLNDEATQKNLFRKKKLNIMFYLQSMTLLLSKMVVSCDHHDYDIHGQNELIQHFSFIVDIDQMIIWLKNYSDNKNDFNDQQLLFSFEFLNLITLLSEKRYLHETLKTILNIPLRKIINIMKLCNKQLKFSKYIARMVYIFFIDPKENLVSQRKHYWTKKPFDLLYDEEIYTDNDFHYLLKYFTVVMQEKEPASAAATEEDHNLFHDIQQNYIISGVIKLCKFILRSEKRDIYKFNENFKYFENFLIYVGGKQYKEGIEKQANNPHKIILVVKLIKELIQFKIKKIKVTEKQQKVLIYDVTFKDHELRQNTKFHDNIIIRQKYFNDKKLQENHSSRLKTSYLKSKRITILTAQFFIDYQRNNLRIDDKFDYILNQKIQNLCNFFNIILSQIETNCHLFYSIVQILCNISFRDNGGTTGETLGEMLSQQIVTKNSFKFFDNLQQEFRVNFSLVRYKGIKDDLYYESLEKTYILIIFQRFLLKNSPTCQKNYGEQIIEMDSNTKLQRLLTILQKLMDPSLQEDRPPPFNTNHDYFWLQADILITLQLVIYQNYDNKIKSFNYLIDRYRNTLLQIDIKFSLTQYQLLQFLNELVSDQTHQINEFVIQGIDLQVVQFLMVQRINDFYFRNLIKSVKNSQKKEVVQYLLKSKNKGHLLSKYKKMISQHIQNEYFNCAVECFNYIQFFNPQFVAEEVRKKNIYFVFLNTVLFKIEYKNVKGNLRLLTIKQDLRSNYLSSKTKILIYHNLSKDEYYSQLKDLFEILPYIDYETAYLHKRPWLKVFYENYRKINVICILIGFAINFLLLYNYEWAQGMGSSDFNTSDKYLLALFALQYSLVGLSSLIVFIHLFFTVSLEYKQNIYFRILKKEKIDILYKIWIFFFESIIFNQISGPFVFYIAICLSSLYSKWQGLFFLIILCLNILEQFRNLLDNLMLRLKKIFQVIFAIFLLCLSFSYLLWAQYSGRNFKSVQNQIQVDDHPCKKSLFECCVYILNYGLRNGLEQLLKYEGFLNSDGVLNKNFYFTKNIVDISFYFLVQLIFIAIVIALIIDGIWEGNHQNRKLKILSEKCLVCNRSKDQFERNSENFYEHINHYHSLWKYAIFIINIRNEKYRSFDNCELDLLKYKIENKDLTWFPNYQDENQNINDNYNDNLETEATELNVQKEQLKKIQQQH